MYWTDSVLVVSFPGDLHGKWTGGNGLGMRLVHWTVILGMRLVHWTVILGMRLVHWTVILGMRQALYLFYLHVLLDSLNGFLSLVFHELFSLFLLLLHHCLLLQQNINKEAAREVGYNISLAPEFGHISYWEMVEYPDLPSVPLVVLRSSPPRL